MAVSTVIQAFLPTMIAGTGIVGSSSITATFNITSAWEAQIPIRTRQQVTTCSAPPEIRVYRSTDGGVSYANVPLPVFSVPLLAGSEQDLTIRLDTGQYAIQLVSGGPLTASFAILTQYVITALQVV